MILKISLALNALLLLCSVILGSLYYVDRNEVKSLIAQRTSLQDNLKTCEENKAKLTASKQVDQSVSTEKEEKIATIEKYKSDKLDKLNNIPSKSTCKESKPIENIKDENHEADIDDKLPSDLISLLSESDN